MTFFKAQILSVKKNDLRTWISTSVVLATLVSCAHASNTSMPPTASANQPEAVMTNSEDEVLLADAIARLNDMGPQGKAIKKNANQRAAFIQDMKRTRRLAHAAEKAGIDKDPRFIQRLAAQREHILAVMYTDRYLDKKTTDAALKRYFEKNKDIFSGEERRAYHIVTKLETTARAAIAAMNEPESNLEILKKEFAPSAPDGTSSGDLGFFARGQMVQAIEDAAFKTAPGNVFPDPVKTDFGWHAIKVTGLKPAKITSFEAARDEVAKRFRAEQHAELIKSLDRPHTVHAGARTPKHTSR